MIRLINFPDDKDLDQAQDNEMCLEDEQEEKEIMDKFVLPLPIFRVFDKPAHSNLGFLEKKVITFSTQYGTHNENTIKMLYNYLEATKEAGCQKLHKGQHLAAIYFFSRCTGFIDPPEPHAYNFCYSKVDVVNKLMHVLLTFRKHERKNDRGNVEIGYLFIQQYLQHVEASSHLAKLYLDLKASVECNYFFAGKFASKSKNDLLAIKYYEKTVAIINDKLEKLDQVKQGTLDNAASIQDHLLALKIKVFYKMSKCYRLVNEKQQQRYQALALNESKSKKYDLYIHLSRKIREFREKRNFKQVLSSLENRKKIENEVFKLIQESKKKEESLYSFYQSENDM